MQCSGNMQRPGSNSRMGSTGSGSEGTKGGGAVACGSRAGPSPVHAVASSFRSLPAKRANERFLFAQTRPSASSLHPTQACTYVISRKQPALCHTSLPCPLPPPQSIASGFFYHTARLQKDGSYRTVKNPQSVHLHPSSSLLQVSGCVSVCAKGVDVACNCVHAVRAPAPQLQPAAGARVWMGPSARLH